MVARSKVSSWPDGHFRKLRMALCTEIHYSISSSCILRPSLIVILNFIYLIIFSENFELWIYLHSFLIPTLLWPIIFLKIPDLWHPQWTFFLWSWRPSFIAIWNVYLEVFTWLAVHISMFCILAQSSLWSGYLYFWSTHSQSLELKCVGSGNAYFISSFHFPSVTKCIESK
jgi:hypothetical protein